jgi:hypothetical protein
MLQYDPTKPMALTFSDPSTAIELPSGLFRYACTFIGCCNSPLVQTYLYLYDTFLLLVYTLITSVSVANISVEYQPPFGSVHIHTFVHGLTFVHVLAVEM